MLSECYYFAAVLVPIFLSEAVALLYFLCGGIFFIFVGIFFLCVGLGKYLAAGGSVLC